MEKDIEAPIEDEYESDDDMSLQTNEDDLINEELRQKVTEWITRNHIDQSTELPVINSFLNEIGENLETLISEGDRVDQLHYICSFLLDDVDQFKAFWELRFGMRWPTEYEELKRGMREFIHAQHIDYVTKLEDHQDTTRPTRSDGDEFADSQESLELESIDARLRFSWLKNWWESIINRFRGRE